MATKEKDVINAIFDAHGIISVAAQNLGITRDALNKRKKSNKRIAAAVDSAREKTRDFAESKIINHMNSENELVSLSATKYYLSTQCKNRGYYTKVETEKNVNKPLIINYVRKTINDETKTN